MDSLADLLEAEFTGQHLTDLHALIGPRTHAEIDEWISGLVRSELGAEAEGALFVSKSVGAVLGLALSSGERVVLKLFHPSQSFEELSVMAQHHGHAVARGFPAAPMRSKVFRASDRLFGAFYEFADGEFCDAHEPAVRRELARSLAELSGIFDGVDPSGLALAPTHGARLWPPSHRSFFDLEENEASRWIDECGRRAQLVIRSESLPLTVAHLDWGVKNTRFRDGKICVVYDWDSLFAASEAELVGRAAVQFTAQWDMPARLTPTLAETQAFIDEYWQARGRRPSAAEVRVCKASAQYLVAHVARFEQVQGAPETDGYLALLREHSGV